MVEKAILELPELLENAGYYRESRRMKRRFCEKQAERIAEKLIRGLKHEEKEKTLQEKTFVQRQA